MLVCGLQLVRDYCFMKSQCLVLISINMYVLAVAVDCFVLAAWLAGACVHHRLEEQPASSFNGLL